jgi:hypothetical protein
MIVSLRSGWEDHFMPDRHAVRASDDRRVGLIGCRKRSFAIIPCGNCWYDFSHSNRKPTMPDIALHRRQQALSMAVALAGVKRITATRDMADVHGVAVAGAGTRIGAGESKPSTAS